MPAHGDRRLETLLAVVPPAAALTAGGLPPDVLAARVAFCAAGLWVGLLTACLRRWPATFAPQGLRPRPASRALWLPLFAVGAAAALLAAAHGLSGASSMGLRTAGHVGAIFAAVMLLPGMPTPAGRLALALLTDGAQDRGAWAAQVARAAAVRAAATVPVALAASGPQAAAAVAALAAVWGWWAERDARRRQVDHLPLTVGELAGPVAELAAASDHPAQDWARWRTARYGVVQHPTAPRLVRLDRIEHLPPDWLMSGAWAELGTPAPVMDGARPVGELHRTARRDEAWLVSAESF